MKRSRRTFKLRITRLGVVLEPNGDPAEVEGVLNPASARDRAGNLLLYTRAVAKGNLSRIGLVRLSETGGKLAVERLGFALEPERDYELNGSAGHGCEDPRVTFVHVLNRYLMAYTAYGSQGPRIAFAWSDDGYKWHRLGLAQFPAELNLPGDDKDAAFFPEPVLSPGGVMSLAFYHRPMVHIPPAVGRSEVETILSVEPSGRQSIRIAYVPLDIVLKDLSGLTRVAESHLVLSPNLEEVKVGAGTPPVLVKEGLLSLYHCVDAIEKKPGKQAMRYRVRVLFHDRKRPHHILYSSPAPVFAPVTADELTGTVNNVVFPTALDPRPDLGDGVFDFYYGMADYKIGRARLTLISRPRKRS